MHKEHPNPDRWWERKWRLAKIGAAFAVLSILIGQIVIIWKGPEYGSAITPIAVAGMWGGLSLSVMFMGTGVAENIANMRKH